jgi:hypothetical protein
LGIFTSAKKDVILVLDVISNAKFEISNQKMIDNTIALNANHSKIQ